MFQQGSSDWCIMTTLRKTPENRLSISRTTLITTVLEQNCSVKQCCSYFSFTLSTSNALHGNTLDFQECKANGVCRLFPGTWFRRSVKQLKQNLLHLHTNMGDLHSLRRAGDLQGKDSGACAGHHSVHDTATHSPQAHWEQKKWCSTSKSSPTSPSTNCIQGDLSEIQALDFSMGFKSHRPFGVVSALKVG